jgi:hypothetical protein
MDEPGVLKAFGSQAGADDEEGISFMELEERFKKDKYRQSSLPQEP